MSSVETGNGNDDGSVGSGGINVKRPAVEIWYDPGVTPRDTPVTVRAENSEDASDVGVTYDINDGLAVLTYAAGTKVTDIVEVFETANPDNVIARFTISVKVDD